MRDLIFDVVGCLSLFATLWGLLWVVPALQAITN